MNEVAPKGKRYKPTEFEHAANVITHAVSNKVCCLYTIS